MPAVAKLLLLPGLDGTGIFFGPLLAHLPAWIDPVVVTYPAACRTYEALLPCVEWAADGLGRFALLGWSFGGPLALMLASRRPAQVSALMLCATFVSPPKPRLARFRFILRTPVVYAMRALRRMPLLIPGLATPEYLEAKRRTWRAVGASALAGRSRAALAVDARALLAACPAPLAYLASTRDEVIPRRCLDEVVRLAAHTEVLDIDGPHLALFTNPLDSAAHIATFLERAERAAA